MTGKNTLRQMRWKMSDISRAGEPEVTRNEEHPAAPRRVESTNIAVLVTRMVSATLTTIAILWAYFRITGWIEEAQETASAVQVIQIYSEGLFYILTFISLLIAAYIFTRWTDR